MVTKRTTKTTTTPTTTSTSTPIAISYIRFSTPEQRKGGSLERQTADTEAWCTRTGIPLDRELTDPGRSAFHGKHRSDKAALGGFLEQVRQGKVPHDSYLVIENLDRLSREEERTALKLWIDILDAGINIVQLHPETVFRHERSDMTDIIRAIIELSRGHSESRMKSVRALANWDRAIGLARTDGRTITRRLPSWIKLTDAGLALVPERALVVKRLFELAAEGYGMAAIVKKLNAENVPAFGDRVKDEDGDGHHRKKDGQPYGCGEWRTSYVRSILSDRRAVGELQPRDAGEHKKGEPIPGYYPPVVTEQDWLAARAAMKGRRNQGALNRQGRTGEGVANLFGGLLKNGRDGSTYYASSRVDNGTAHRVLLNKSSIEGKARAFTFPLGTFETALLSELRELDPAAVVGRQSATAAADVLQQELAWVRERKAALAAELLKGDVAAVAEALRGLEAREQELVAAVDDASIEAVKPLADSWRDAHTLIDLLDTDDAQELEDRRLRLRAALRRVVSEIWLVVVSRGRDRLCAVQVFLADGRRRDYLILRRQPLAGGIHKGRVPGYWKVRSTTTAETAAIHRQLGIETYLVCPDHGPGGEPWDLRNQEAAADCAESWERMPQDVLERVFGGCEPHAIP
jgi:DNA invertase Pin-like site-specific DNA recombinase